MFVSSWVFAVLCVQKTNGRPGFQTPVPSQHPGTSAREPLLHPAAGAHPPELALGAGGRLYFASAVLTSPGREDEALGENQGRGRGRCRQPLRWDTSLSLSPWGPKRAPSITLWSQHPEVNSPQDHGLLASGPIFPGSPGCR